MARLQTARSKLHSGGEIFLIYSYLTSWSGFFKY